MINKIKRYILVTITGLTLLAPGLVVGVASAANPTCATGVTSTQLKPCDPVVASIATGLCEGSNIGTGATDCKTNSSTASIRTLAASIINVFSIIVGLVAVIMVIFGGFKYITSGGDSNSVSGAKNTLIYAIIGLIIVALAQFLVRFVINTATGTGLAG